MCGIAGIARRDPDARIDPEILTRMSRAIRHRGPDDEGRWFGAGVALAHRRLSIIDLSPAGHQPMCNEDETVWLVFNGEIYNFQELRDELATRGHRFRSQTDSEVILHLYEELGERCVERLEGMFAFGLWDVRERRLLLARDRLGKKPLKYVELADGIAFSSELKSLLAAGLTDREPDDADVDRFLAFGYVPAPGTGFARIAKLPAAHRLVWDARGTRVERWWSLDYRAKRTMSAADWRAEVRSTVRGAVVRRLVSDVPVGAFLSGGIDSTIVVACMAEASSRPIETFSIGFELQQFNELPFARRTAEKFATNHHEFVVRADDASLLPTLARLYEEPYADSSALPSWLLARETRRHVTVALNGDGGDEGFVGYERYRTFVEVRRKLAPLRSSALRAALRSGARWAALPPRVRRYLEVAAGLASPSVGDAYFWSVRSLTPSERRALYGPRMRALAERARVDTLAAWADDPKAGEDVLDRISCVDAMTYLPDDLLVKMDLATMAHALEARSPLLDHRVLELAAAIPAEIRAPRADLKRLLKDAFADVFPPGHLERPKSGFAIPLQDWFRGPWRELVHDTLLARDARVLRWFERAPLEQLVRNHESREIDLGFQLWTLLMLELWMREVVEAPLDAPQGWAVNA
jgi:asparagine synthase (glutamine-hydrolysing)